MEETSSSGTVVAETGEVRENAAEIESLLGYTFRDPSLLTEALTHRSYPDRPCYDRLEFVGDAVLGLAVTRFLYFLKPALDCGLLTDLRSANVSTEKLARVAVRHDLYRFLRRKCPSLDLTVSKFTEAVKMEGEEDAGEVSFGPCKVLADMVESIAAAVYIDCNFDLDVVWEVFRKILEPIITSDNMHDPVSVLQEFYQKTMRGKIPKYISSRKGSSWVVKATIDGKVVGRGAATNKPTAKLKAARDALKMQCQFEADVVEARAAEVKDFSMDKLHQICKKNNWKKPEFRTEKEEGPPHCPKFTCSIHIEREAGDTISACGIPEPTKKAAQNSAAFNLFSDIVSGVLGVLGSV